MATAACTDVVASVIPYYWTPCWYALDPASLLATSHFYEGMTEFPAGACSVSTVSPAAPCSMPPTSVS